MRKITVFQKIVAFFIGYKYYVNIINVRGTNECETTSFIHYTREQAMAHRLRIEETSSFMYIETVSFRSHKLY